MLLEDKRILIIGATGFIGSHLARRLALKEQAKVTGTGRDLEKATHLNGLGIQLRKLEITDTVAIRELVQGQDIIFHLVAAPGTSSPDVAQEVNVSAAENLVREAAAAGVSRFVHISSMAAYGPPNQPVIGEDCPLNVEQSALYGRTESIDDILTFYTSQTVYPSVKAEQLLGYRPRVSLDQGMRRTEEWLREAGYL